MEQSTRIVDYSRLNHLVEVESTEILVQSTKYEFCLIQVIYIKKKKRKEGIKKAAAQIDLSSLLLSPLAYVSILPPPPPPPPPPSQCHTHYCIILPPGRCTPVQSGYGLELGIILRWRCRRQSHPPSRSIGHRASGIFFTTSNDCVSSIWMLLD